MKKFYLPALAVIWAMAFAYPVTAQITLTQADMPKAGITVVSNYDLSPTVTPGSSGASVNWNFSALNNSSSQTTTFVTAASTPYAGKFPAANLADSIYDTAGYTFLSSTSSAFSVVGVTSIAGYNIDAQFTPPLEEVGLPANYLNHISGTTNVSTGAMAFHSPPFDSGKAHLQFNYADTIDAWGSVTTPSGTYSVLRQKHYELDKDSLFVHNTITHQWSYYPSSPKPTKSYEYVWFANAVNYPIVQMKMDSTGKNVVNVLWYQGPLGVSTVNAKQGGISVYPNPCTSQITFMPANASGTRILNVFDVAGRQMTTASMGNGAYYLNTSGYAKGLYLYRITDAGGSFIAQGKFVVE